jgi:phosphoadenosine phosphosulfate reductase
MTQSQTGLTADEVAQLNTNFASAEPEELLAWALERFHPRMAISSSFGAEDVALIDMAWRINPQARVVTLDTLRLHTETYEVIDQIRHRYGINVEIFAPDLAAVQRMVAEKGYNLFYQSIDNRKLCCGIRKVEPLERALAGLDAWVSGMRRDQVATRNDIAPIELDAVHPGVMKLNPLADWSSDQVWAYIREHDVPYNQLHDQGFPSIGCAPCTRAVQPGEDPRAGRWWWELDPNAKECGIHTGYDFTQIVVSPEVTAQRP